MVYEMKSVTRTPENWLLGHRKTTMAQMAHFSFPYNFTIPNSAFRIPKFALRISEFGIVKYMLYGQVVTVNLL